MQNLGKGKHGSLPYETNDWDACAFLQQLNFTVLSTGLFFHLTSLEQLCIKIDLYAIVRHHVVNCLTWMQESSSCCYIGTSAHAGFCCMSKLWKFSTFLTLRNTENVVPGLSVSLVPSSVRENSCLFSSQLPEDSLKLEEVHQECLKHAILHDISSVESILLTT